MRQVINMVALLALLATLTSCGESTDLPMANDDCAGAYDLEFICNLISPEDVVAIPYSNLVVVSGYQQGPSPSSSKHGNFWRLSWSG